MFCSKCGKEVEKGTKFCPGCGEKIEEKKVVEATKVETKKEEQPRSKALGVVALVLGIVSIVLAIFLNIFIILIPIVGLILALCFRGKKSLKIAGIVTNAVAMVLAIVLCIVSFYIFGGLLGMFAQDIGHVVKSGYPYGEWTCVNYYGSSAKTYADDVTLAPDKDKTVLNLKSDNSYVYGPKVDAYKNYYKGSFTYTVEVEKNEQYSGQGVSFLDVKAPITSAMIDGVVNTKATEMHFEMELLEKDNYDTAIIGFYDNYSINNIYYCQR